jgi:hypothetical protein
MGLNVGVMCGVDMQAVDAENARPLIEVHSEALFRLVHTAPLPSGTAGEPPCEGLCEV